MRSAASLGGGRLDVRGPLTGLSIIRSSLCLSLLSFSLYSVRNKTPSPRPQSQASRPSLPPPLQTPCSHFHATTCPLLSRPILGGRLPTCSVSDFKRHPPRAVKFVPFFLPTSLPSLARSLSPPLVLRRGAEAPLFPSARAAVPSQFSPSDSFSVSLLRWDYIG